MNGVKTAVPIDEGAIAAFCRKWRIRELALFGSILTDEFRADSDVDVLITFEEADPDLGPWTERLGDMTRELESIFGRRVDLVQKKLIRNPFRRYQILTTRRVLYAA